MERNKVLLQRLESFPGENIIQQSKKDLITPATVKVFPIMKMKEVCVFVETECECVLAISKSINGIY